jgi:N-acetylmuramoyl-L-alanine amidase
MSRGPLRLFCALLGLASVHASEPRRPLPTVRIDGREYVRVADVAARLALGLRWIEPGRRVLLADSVHRLELSAGGHFEGREMSADGLTVYLGDPVVSSSGELFVSRIDLEHRLVPLVHPSWCGPPPRPPRTIVIDPGHGGDDSGTQNLRLHLMEKTFTLDTAFRLRRLLEAAGYRVIMTRTGDYKLDRDHDTDLRLRGEVAVVNHADLFLSIHYNSVAPDTRTHGTEVYTFCPEHQRSTDSWGRHEDDSEPSRDFPGASPANRNDLWNVVFAHAMHRQLLARLGTEDRGEKLRHLGVLRPLDCPGILVESAFLSNDAEAERVATPAFRQRIAEAMLAGIQAYASEIARLQPGAPSAR